MDSIKGPWAMARGFSIAACLVLVTALGCTRFSQTTEPHVVGHLAPRSGPEQAAGLRAGDAVAMAVEEFNVVEQNRIDKRTVAVIHADAGPDFKGFGFQATRLLSVNKVAVLLGATRAAQLDQLAPAALAGQVVLVSPSGGNGGPLNRLVYSVGLDPRERGRCLAKFAAEERKVADIVTIASDAQPVFAVVSEGFAKEYRHPDRTIRHEHVYHSGADLVAILGRHAKARPAAILFCGPPADLVTLRGEWKDVPTFFGGEEDEVALRHDADLCEGVVFTTAIGPDEPTVQEFAKKFRNRPKHQAPEADDALSVDAATVLFQAAKRATTFRAAPLDGKGPSLREELNKGADFECLTGPLWFSPDQTARRKVYVVQMRSGRASALKEYAPEKK